MISISLQKKKKRKTIKEKKIFKSRSRLICVGPLRLAKLKCQNFPFPPSIFFSLVNVHSSRKRTCHKKEKHDKQPGKPMA